MGFHKRVADGGDAVENRGGGRGGGAGERADEIYERIRPLSALVETLESEGHGEDAACGVPGSRAGLWW